LGKHIDKAPQDGPMGTHTLPVLLGEKVALRVNQVISVLFYFVVAFLVLAGDLSVWVLLLVLLSVPKLIETLKLFGQPRPPEYQDAPLYYVGVAFYFTRRAGFLFIAGLIVSLVVGLFFPDLFKVKLF
jgi:1,4-dihydroxy-2-naphthoate octaprenyltransferase